MAPCVKRMIFDKWNGLFCEEEEVANPLLHDIEKAIENLDADTRTVVSLYAGDGGFLTIGGGAGKYIAYVSTPNEELWNLINGESRNDRATTLINIGGQPGDFPARQVATKEQVIEAAEFFGTAGKMHPNLPWEQ